MERKKLRCAALPSRTPPRGPPNCMLIYKKSSFFHPPHSQKHQVHRACFDNFGLLRNPARRTRRQITPQLLIIPSTALKCCCHNRRSISWGYGRRPTELIKKQQSISLSQKKVLICLHNSTPSYKYFSSATTVQHLGILYHYPPQI